MSYLFECVKKIAFLINNKDEQSKGEIRNILNRSYIHHLGTSSNQRFLLNF